MHSRCTSYVERIDLKERMDEYLSRTDDYPLIVYGQVQTKLHFTLTIHNYSLEWMWQDKFYGQVSSEYKTCNSSSCCGCQIFRYPYPSCFPFYYLRFNQEHQFIQVPCNLCFTVLPSKFLVHILVLCSGV